MLVAAQNLELVHHASPAKTIAGPRARYGKIRSGRNGANRSSISGAMVVRSAGEAITRHQRFIAI
jgi:hypothetical protein